MHSVLWPKQVLQGDVHWIHSLVATLSTYPLIQVIQEVEDFGDEQVKQFEKQI